MLRLADPGSLPELTSALETDRRLHVQVKQERQFYDDQAGTVVLALTGLAILRRLRHGAHFCLVPMR